MKTLKKITVLLLVVSMDVNPAIQTFRAGMSFPSIPNQISTSPGFTTTQLLIDGASEKAANIFRVSKTGTVNKILWATRTVTTGATLDVRL